ncbi:disintegrin and metalloproteinase domain-containing protein 10-like isoform X1 [Centruroides sculpturatus]|uniref:disintegrin and metalloproteinase domain-containing protein 10-like isoform X1 n=1 Tax=Centruroides sculpturatus TaxID=218467 RepID=UPI000C6E5B9E|nr:disintegrin and metalloproteinase domain-containing protein 10-like isoform X1 [Centruroides sculpturatus]
MILCFTFGLLVFSVMYGEDVETFRKYPIPIFRRYEPFRLINSKSISRNDIHYSRLTWKKKITFQFMAFHRFFHVVAYRSTLSADATVYIHNRNNVTMKNLINLGIEVYTGWLVGHRDSFVVGFFNKNVFQSIIVTEEETFNVELASKYLKNKTNFDAIVYRSSDIIILSENNGSKCGSIANWKIKSLKIAHDAGRTFESSNERTVCNLDMVSDISLYDKDNSNEADIIQQMLFLVTAADRFFSKFDFNRDGQRDNIGITASRFTIFKDFQSTLYPFRNINNSTDIEKYLKSAENYENDCCLVHFLFFKSFESDKSVVASFGGSENNGICMNSRRTFRSRNVVITTRKYGPFARPLIEASYLFAHGVAHAFGAPHTNANRKGQNFLMDPHFGMLDLTKTTLSNYSIDSISGIIHERGSWCLRKEDDAVCGNRITEEGEECDCGDRSICDSIDPSCTPSDGNGTDKPCSLRRSENKICSPRESVCCTKDGKYVRREDKKICTSNLNECVKPQICNGKSSDCKQPSISYHRKLCAGNSRFCYHSFCNGSICFKHELLDCECTDDFYACHVCCVYKNICNSFYLLAKPLYKEVPIKRLGEYCMNKTGYCNVDGKCIKFEFNPYESLKYSSIHHNDSNLMFLFFAFLISAIILSIIYNYIKRGKERRLAIYFQKCINIRRKDLSHEITHINISQINTFIRLSTLFPSVSLNIIFILMKILSEERLVVISIVSSGIPMRIEFEKPIFIPKMKYYKILGPKHRHFKKKISKIKRALSYRLEEEML